jgi:hypothetical protein
MLQHIFVLSEGIGILDFEVLKAAMIPPKPSLP